jgi:hypothetical protein
MKFDSGILVRFVVLAVLSAATAGMIVVSIRANFLFGYSLGRTDDKALIFAWANVSTDIWKVFGLILISRLWRQGQPYFAIVLVPVWLLCVLWGMIGAIGIYAQDRATLVAERRDSADSRVERKRKIAEINRKLSSASTRTVEQVDAAIAAILARPVWTRQQKAIGTVGAISINCTRENRATIDACLEVAILRQERVQAEEASRLHEMSRQLEFEISTTRDVGASISVDTTAEFLAWLTNEQIHIDNIAFGFPLVFALLIELLSALGPTAIVASANRRRHTRDEPRDEVQRDEAGHSLSRPALAGQGEPRHIAQWMAEQTEPSAEESMVSIVQLYDGYCQWCLRKRIVAIEIAVFERAFDRLRKVQQIRGSIKKYADRYSGIRVCS